MLLLLVYGIVIVARRPPCYCRVVVWLAKVLEETLLIVAVGIQHWSPCKVYIITTKKRNTFNYIPYNISLSINSCLNIIHIINYLFQVIIWRARSLICSIRLIWDWRAIRFKRCFFIVPKKCFHHWLLTKWQCVSTNKPKLQRC